MVAECHFFGIRRVNSDLVQHYFPFKHCFLFKRGVRGGGSPPLFFYLNMLFKDALVNISNFCDLYYISYIKKKTFKEYKDHILLVACCL